VYGETVPKENEAVKKVKAHVEGKQDPGYGETSKMLAESALLLVYQRDQLDKKMAGIGTPASSLGLPLVDRLRKAGMVFTIDDE